MRRRQDLRRRILFEMSEKIACSRFDAQVFEKFLFEFHAQRQAKAQNIANDTERKIALNDLGEDLGGRAVRLAPARHDFQ